MAFHASILVNQILILPFISAELADQISYFCVSGDDGASHGHFIDDAPSDGGNHHALPFFTDLLVELPIHFDAFLIFLILDGVFVFLQRSDELIVVVHHLTVETQQVVVLVCCHLQLTSQQ